MSGALLEGIAITLFLLVSAYYPRVSEQGIVSWDTLINVMTGLGLFLVRVTLVAWVAAHSSVGLVPMDWLGPSWAQFAVALVLLDFARYWVHRLDHRVPWLWTFHRVHHSSERLDATSGLRMHLVDFLQLSAIPVVLFSILLDSRSLAPWVVPAALSVGVVMDAFQHANIRFELDRPWKRAWHRVLNNPLFHAWHHTRDGELCDGNYGNTFVFWDRLFGSEVTRPVPPEAYGLEDHQALDNTVVGLQLLRPRGLGGRANERSSTALRERSRG